MCPTCRAQCACAFWFVDSNSRIAALLVLKFLVSSARAGFAGKTKNNHTGKNVKTAACPLSDQRCPNPQKRSPRHRVPPPLRRVRSLELMWGTAHARCHTPTAIKALHRLATVFAATLCTVAIAFRTLPRTSGCTPQVQQHPYIGLVQFHFALALVFAFAERFLTLVVPLWTKSRKMAATTRPTCPARWTFPFSFLHSYRLNVHILVVPLHLFNVHGLRF